MGLIKNKREDKYVLWFNELPPVGTGETIILYLDKNNKNILTASMPCDVIEDIKTTGYSRVKFLKINARNLDDDSKLLFTKALKNVFLCSQKLNSGVIQLYSDNPRYVIDNDLQRASEINFELIKRDNNGNLIKYVYDLIM